MPTKRLTPQHPLHQKLVALEQYMVVAGIELQLGYGRLVLVDKQTDLSVDIRDNDSGEPVDSVPSMFEWKLTLYEE